MSETKTPEQIENEAWIQADQIEDRARNLFDIPVDRVGHEAYIQAESLMGQAAAMRAQGSIARAILERIDALTAELQAAAQGRPR